MESTSPPKKRKTRPRAPLVVAPVSCSQRTFEAIFGIDERRGLQLLREHPEVPRAKVGKLVVVEVDDMRDLLRRLAVADDTPTEITRDDQPESADGVLASLGLRATSGAAE